MARQQPNTPESETPFQRFARGVREIVAVPKKEIDRREKKWKRDREKKLHRT